MSQHTLAAIEQFHELLIVAAIICLIRGATETLTESEVEGEFFFCSYLFPL